MKQNRERGQTKKQRKKSDGDDARKGAEAAAATRRGGDACCFSFDTLSLLITVPIWSRNERERERINKNRETTEQTAWKSKRR